MGAIKADNAPVYYLTCQDHRLIGSNAVINHPFNVSVQSGPCSGGFPDLE